ncbi:hypothetical protein L6164_010019 [Bauhinia variegata]|uniref:Uncharacterized protein n=1 Tax=Bauhinia variegata TaxID=167791 RepID=A0ACB9PS84_BAUVA|nr:hypothetical protein L6164_010019 [Bauhinia variegata]
MQDTLNWLVLMIELIHRIGSNRLAIYQNQGPFVSSEELLFRQLNQRETEEVVDSIFLSSGQNRSITGLVFAVKGAILIAFASI